MRHHMGLQVFDFLRKQASPVRILSISALGRFRIFKASSNIRSLLSNNISKLSFAIYESKRERRFSKMYRPLVLI